MPDPFIACDHSGGNIVVTRRAGRVFSVRPDLRDTTTQWFYWYFRVRGAPGQDLRFQFPADMPVMSVRGPAFSRDGGQNWHWLGGDAVAGNGFSYCFGPAETETHFSMGMPYTEDDLHRFLAGRAPSPLLAMEPHCLSRHGRTVERLRFGCNAASPPHRVAITCRHHCCEMMANYVLEGLIDAVTGEGSESGWLKENVAFAALPFVDKDGVEEGDQGKNRAPHDHGRDYGEKRYPAVAGWCRFLSRWSNEHLDLGLDLHCPFIRGGNSEHIHLVGVQSEPVWRKQRRFGRVLERCRRGPLPYRTENAVPFGTAWNVPANYRQGMTFGGWLQGRFPTGLPLTIEVPYADADGVAVDARSAREFGRDLAVAVATYLRSVKTPA